MHHQQAALCSSAGSAKKQEQNEGQLTFHFTKITNIKTSTTALSHSTNSKSVSVIGKMQNKALNQQSFQSQI